MLHSWLFPSCVRAAALLTLLAALTGAPVLAQGSQLPGCATGGAQDFEIGLRINSEQDFYITFHSLETSFSDEAFVYAGQYVDLTGCNWVAHVGEPAGPGRTYLPSGEPIAIRFYHNDSDTGEVGALLFSYTYALHAGPGSFYTPYALTGGYADLLLYHEADGRMRVYPTQIANVGANYTTGDVNAAFTDSGWILPHNAERVCQHYSGAACPSGFYTNIPFITPQVGPTYTLTGDVDLVQPAGQSWTWSAAEPVTALRFPQGRKLVTRGTLSTNGLTFTAANQSQRWGGVAVAQGHLNLTGGAVDWATTGVAVFDPARATLTDATVAQNTTGLDVRSRGSGGAPGALVQGVLFDVNGTGVRSGERAAYGGGAACLTDCRSRFTLQDSPAGHRTVVRASPGGGVGLAGTGVYAFSADAIITRTDITANGGVGLRVANALVNPFRENTMTANGGYGASVMTAGNFRLSPTGAKGLNRVAENAGTGGCTAASPGAEVWVFDGGQAFFGDGASNGYNAVYHLAGGCLVRYPAGPTLPAERQWWGSVNGPPTGALAGPVDACPHLTCDPTTNPNCNSTACDLSLRAGGPGGGVSAARTFGATAALRGDEIVIGDSTGEEAFLDSLAVEITALQALLAVDGDGPGADTLVAALAMLHRLDLEDQTGEWSESSLLLGALRGRLVELDLDADARASGEAALVAETIIGLEREAYAETAGLLGGYAALAEGVGAVRQLALVEAFLLALDGRRAEAAALVAELAAEAEDAAEAEELAVLASALADEGGGAALLPGGDLAATASEEAAGVGAGGVWLGVAPNPAAEAATVTLALPGSARVRVAVYDVLGREVARLADGPLETGAHRLALDSSSLPPGAYVARATVEPTGGVARTLAHRFTVLR